MLLDGLNASVDCIDRADIIVNAARQFIRDDEGLLCRVLLLVCLVIVLFLC